MTPKEKLDIIQEKMARSRTERACMHTERAASQLIDAIKQLTKQAERISKDDALKLTTYYIAVNDEIKNISNIYRHTYG
ncbi:MAG: hypothetical protein FWB80_07485 [Defluviitaleaceae bacterium]|nr:hypothetical protein [Defluviitaleaceae bacterium]